MLQTYQPPPQKPVQGKAKPIVVDPLDGANLCQNLLVHLDLLLQSRRKVAMTFCQLLVNWAIFFILVFCNLVPMNKVKVGMSSSPNLKEIKSKVGSLANTTYKPGGGEVKIESRKLEWKAGARTQAKNDGYTPKGGERKVGVRAW